MLIRQKCDFCDKPAKYDAKTKLGPWAFLCQQHFETYATGIPGEFSELPSDAFPIKKVCVLCGQEKPISEFYRYVDKRGETRFRNECKACNLMERKKRRLKRG